MCEGGQSGRANWELEYKRSQHCRVVSDASSTAQRAGSRTSRPTASLSHVCETTLALPSRACDVQGSPHRDRAGELRPARHRASRCRACASTSVAHARAADATIIERPQHQTAPASESAGCHARCHKSQSQSCQKSVSSRCTCADSRKAIAPRERVGERLDRLGFAKTRPAPPPHYSLCASLAVSLSCDASPASVHYCTNRLLR